MSNTQGCGFHESHFGAPYPDACCIDGYLWDEDSIGPDGLLYGGGEEPCPQCNHERWMERHKDQTVTDGYVAQEDGLPREPPEIGGVWHEQLNDRAIIAMWWLQGWDQAAAEAAERCEHGVHHGTWCADCAQGFKSNDSKGTN